MREVNSRKISYIVNTGTLFGVSCRVSRVYGGLWGFIAVLGSV